MSVPLVLFLSAVALLLFLMMLRERRQNTRAQEHIEEAREIGSNIPVSLHPVIDLDVCIGTAACALACPEQTVLEIAHGRGHLAHAAECVGHGRCQDACPVDAITLVFGCEERGVDIPVLSGTFETVRRGIYIAGELGGMGLVRNATRQGEEAAEYIHADLQNHPHNQSFDLLVIGAGPAGISASARAAQLGLRTALLDQGEPGGTVLQYPRHKIILTQPFSFPGFGLIDKHELSKAELMAILQKSLVSSNTEIFRGKLFDIEGECSSFSVQFSEAPQTVSAARVLLALGRRGSPRLLQVPGENSMHVTYRLMDDWQYEGKTVLVVGGGDSALESALALVKAGAKVSLSYRKAHITRAKKQNRQALQQAIESKTIIPYWETQLAEIDPDFVRLVDNRHIAAEYVIIQAGGEPPRALLDKLGIRVETRYG